MGRLALLVLTLLLFSHLPADAETGRRVALVVGNANYAVSGALANPLNDAADISEQLRELGFEVIEGHDLGKRALEQMIGRFSDQLEGAEAGLLYYAGHGLQVDGRNFIVPVDAKLDSAVKLRLEAVQIDDILDVMEQQVATSLVFLDACRNNPFVHRLRAVTNRSATALPGLAQFDSTRGSFIAFSTAPGAVAMDGSGRNSPFAAALLRHMAEPGQSINDLMIAVRRDVIAQTRGTQRPWEQGSLIERFDFVVSGGSPAPPKPAVDSPVQLSALARSVGDAASIESFLRDTYLSPDPSDIARSVRRTYAEEATIFGSKLDAVAIGKMKGNWFAQWRSWSLELEPGSLSVSQLAKHRAAVDFTMRYVYDPKDGSVASQSGRAQVSLGLVLLNGEWRVSSESSAAILP